jgi:hypothetical protein
VAKRGSIVQPGSDVRALPRDRRRRSLLLKSAGYLFDRGTKERALANHRELLLKKFWLFDGDPAHPDAAPAPLVYADLMASGDERNAETAEMIYDRYIARSFGKA